MNVNWEPYKKRVRKSYKMVMKFLKESKNMRKQNEKENY